MQIKIFTVGGTIDKFYYDRKDDFQVGEPQIAEALKEANVTASFSVESLMRKDSLDMGDVDRDLIRHRVAGEPARRVLITHGTDTMVTTARALGEVGEKTVVLTGSMQPARLRYTDALFNIGFAFAAVQLLPPGVYVAMNGRVFPCDNVVKNVAEQRFETVR